MICAKCKNNIPNWVRIDGKMKNLRHRKFCLACSPFNKHNTRNLAKPHIKKDGRIMKLKAIEYKGGKCSSCNYDKCIANLTFHHLDETQKDFTIGDGNSRTFDVIKIELDKCILLCRNCHGELHWDETKSRRNIISNMQ